MLVQSSKVSPRWPRIGSAMMKGGASRTPIADVHPVAWTQAGGIRRIDAEPEEKERRNRKEPSLVRHVASPPVRVAVEVTARLPVSVDER